MQEEFQQHISKRFNEDMTSLASQLLHMGGLVEQQVQQSMEALLTADSARAEQVRHREDDVNDQDLQIGDACARMLALRQPAASDLRMILAIGKCVSDLERIGDEAHKIAGMALQLAAEGPSPCGYVEVRRIAKQVGGMLHDVLHAFVRQDVELAIKAAGRDEEVDMEYASAMRSLVTFMMAEPRTIGRVMNMMWVLRALERIGDHACNIAEQVVYLVKGQDMRHASRDEMRNLLDK